MSIPRHHPCFDRAQWSRGYAGDIRHAPMMQIPINRVSHAALHNSIAIVPVPDRHTLQRVVSMFEPIEGDYLGTLNNLITSIDMASAHEQCSPDDRLLSELTMRALHRQIPFIKEGMLHYVR